MSYLTPVMALVTALLSLMLDPWDEFRRNNYFNNPWHVTRSCLLMLFGGTLAFFMVGIGVEQKGTGENIASTSRKIYMHVQFYVISSAY